MMKKLLIGCFLFTLVSCEKKSNLCCVVIDARFDIIYKNAAGEDLLNPDSDGYLGGTSDIMTFSLKNGVKTAVYYGNLDSPRLYGIHWSEEAGTHILGLSFDIHPENFDGNKVTMFLRYKDGSEDKLVGEFNPDRRNLTLLQRVWLDDELVWDTKDGATQRYLELVK